MSVMTDIFLIAPLPLLLLLFTIGAFKCKHLLPLWKHDRQIKLDFSPNELSGIDITIVIVIFFLRSVRFSILSTCTRIFKLRNMVSEVPKSPDADELSLVMPFRVTQADLTTYSAAIKDPLDSRNNQLSGAQLLLFLSALSEPAMLLLLAHPSCKVRPLGSVNVRNRFELLRPDLLCEGQALTALKKAFLTATLSKDDRVVKRGFEVDLVVNLNIPSKDSGSSITVFRQNFTILQFARVRREMAQQQDVARNGVFNPAWSNVTSLAVEYNDPAQWARLCKDYNPIHTSTIAAKIFGFPGKLAHGNHVGALAAKYITLPSENEPLFMEITFKRPVVVPAQLDLKVSRDGAEASHADFQILSMSKDKVSIEGRVGQLK
ncbi:uncharacterized protein Z520_08682 [Fonsecaea multimorphosa CBS 102226]|uniref:MaoC-like domain-containing protein n=1 Tax=Fonsecaea multimorphosa CBS 102226 TaxID=1442371 RepID=A0A0D2JQD1_9EURO|nr:uncharacterized protein Z520_08682 [Fonsecaea multimorphosa CBS 102226]KIX95562.1 hypothetical protein Z520_08682 [Fonsecaea multimorphosa CBS 102226]OAL21408.1 hypothetical protein AYO22_08131 [Fonsecaea multimorphosa]